MDIGYNFAYFSQIRYTFALSFRLDTLLHYIKDLISFCIILKILYISIKSDHSKNENTEMLKYILKYQNKRPRRV